ncbi:MAG: DegV family protein [Clostridiales bacterium]
MNKQPIAILVDSGCDIPEDFRNKYHIYQLPLAIIFSDKHYCDGEDITPQLLYAKMATELPTTSLPKGSDVQKMLEKITADGYQKVLVVTISSRLSGVGNMIRLHAEQYPDLDITVIDTKNISMAAGLVAIAAAERLEQGMDWLELKKQALLDVAQSKVLFSLMSLDNLRRGGRIGLVKGLLGSIIHICPIVSCNDEGVYYIDAKAKGWSRSLLKLTERAEHYAAGATALKIAVLHGNAAQDAAAVKERLLQQLPFATLITEGQINPSLAVHTGPGIVGIAMLRI